MRKQIRILLFEHGSVADWATALKAQITAAVGQHLVLRHEHDSFPEPAHSPVALASSITSFTPHLVILLLQPEQNRNLDRLLATWQQQANRTPLVVAADIADPEVLKNVFEHGTSDFLLPPFRPFEVWPRLGRLLDFHKQQSCDTQQLKEKLGLRQLIGESPLLIAQIQRIPELARCNATVLISGETGTGKELCARAVHYLSSRSALPFVALNSGAIPVELAENELFGHESGAFTGANSAQQGAIREADGGSLFLDEIDSLPCALQVKLLRFLQDKEFRPLGARKACRADVRIIAASNTNLEAEVKAGRFRQDLFYRLNVLRLDLPSLRKRLEDIPLLARYFLAVYAAEFDKPVRDIAQSALDKLAGHDWPGNVRELENVIERAVALCRGLVLLPGDIDVPVSENAPVGASFRQLKAKIIADFERDYLANLLGRCDGNIAQAARAAQKNRRAFFQLMRKHHIRVQPLAAKMDKVVIEVDRNVHPKLTLP
jgi:DNA-binding NtrC family response regulator